MRCDIHLYIEVLTKNGWELYSHPWISRDYSLFAKMAGVRNYDEEITPISEPKGLPTDVSFLTRKSYDNWGLDAHNASWLNSEEIKILANWYEKNRDGIGFEHEGIYTYLEGNCFWPPFPEWIEDCRFVFWFDN